MKRILFGLFFALNAAAAARGASSFDKNDFHLMNTSGLFDVVAPTVPGDIDQVNRVVGQIYYDVVNGSFKGINKTGSIDVLSVSGTNAVTSGGIERVERAYITITGGAATVASQSTASFFTAAYNSPGSITVSFPASGWSSAPSCTCTASNSGGPMLCEFEGGISIGTTGQIPVGLWGSAGNTSAGVQKDSPFYIVCSGAR